MQSEPRMTKRETMCPCIECNPISGTYDLDDYSFMRYIGEELWNLGSRALSWWKHPVNRDTELQNNGILYSGEEL